jgi:hypothetical protein
VIRRIVLRWKVRHLFSEMTPEERLAFERKRSIAEIRATFAFFGYDLSDMTDEQIEEGVQNVARVLATVGVSARDAAQALSFLARVTP